LKGCTLFASWTSSVGKNTWSGGCGGTFVAAFSCDLAHPEGQDGGGLGISRRETIIPAIYSGAQSGPPVDSNVILQVSVASDRRDFHIGESIPLQLSFSSAVKDRYQINMAQYDRSGRMNYEHFSVSPESGAVDPLANYQGGPGGGLTGFKFLTLNEWVRVTRPGEYRLAVTSDRAGVRDPSNSLDASPITARSSEVMLKVIPAPRTWQKQVFDKAVVALDESAPTKPQDLEKYTQSRRQALETLRFLGTPEATRELVKRMRGDGSGGLDYVCMLGLISSPEREVARRALKEALADPDHPIDGNFLYTMRTVNSESDTFGEHWQEDQRRAVGELVAALPNKRGTALSISLSTAVNEAWDGKALPQQTTEKLVEQLLSTFDQLPLQDQNTLLTFRWGRIASPTMLPILRRYAQSYRDFPEMREVNAYNSLQLSASALQHWYELDPAGARPAIVNEITRPRPRFDARVLGMLPDATLPEVGFALAQHLTASEDFEGSSNLASLIARYASEAILPQVTAKLDPSIGKWACAIQDPLLAYILRVSPALARPRIEEAVAARGKDFSACNHGLFQSISEIQYDPTLEDIGIRSLDDPDPQVAETAATMLGKFGSPAAESALWQRYASWSAEWAGRESELDLTFAEHSDDRIYQLGLGYNLMQALATATSWLSDESKLQRLAQLTRVRRVHEQLDGYMKIWRDPPLTISFNHNSPPLGFDARVAQYEFHSMDTLKEKLTQFPSGTKFLLSTPPIESSANGQSLAELRAFLSGHGMAVAGEKKEY
jgi:hypothetical protein